MRRYRSATPSLIKYDPVLIQPPSTAWNGNEGFEYWVPSPNYEVGNRMPATSVGVGYGADIMQVPYAMELNGYAPPGGAE